VLKNKLKSYQYFILLFLMSLLIYVLGVIRVKSIIWGDSLYYYSYTRSIVMDADIDFTNQAFHPKLGFPNIVEISDKTGLITNKFSPGTSLFWIPGFMIGQLLASFSNYILMIFNRPLIFLTDGNGFLPEFFTAVSSVLYSSLGLWYLFKLIKLWFNKKTASLTVLLLFFTTQIFYYTSVDPVNSHSISFLLSSILLYQLTKVLKTNPSWQKVIPMGIVAGLLVLVRNQDIVVIAPVLLAILLSKKESLLNKLNWITLFLGSAFVIFSIQIYTTLTLFGVLGSPYLIRGEKLSWFKPDFFRVLFSFENGLFFFAPILLFAVMIILKFIIINSKNLFNLKKLQANPLLLFVITAMITFLLQLYVVASWGEEIIGGPYGTRMFISILPHLSIGLAIILNKTKDKFNYIYWLMLIALFINISMQTFLMLYRF